MNRTFFILLSVILIIILLGVWIYVLFFGTPQNIDETFTNFGFGDTQDPAFVPTPIDTTPKGPTVDTTSLDRLRQLTSEPVIGYQEVKATASSTPVLYYIAAGTGHIFSIDLTSGEEERISGTTIPAIRQAALTQNGKYVLIQAGQGASHQTNIGSIQSDTSITIRQLEAGIVSFTSTADNTFLYAVQTNNSLVVKHYFPISQVSDTLFTVPFREATMHWGDRASDAHYVYPHASSELEGYVYQVADRTISRLPIDGYGVSAAGNEQFVLYGSQVSGSYKTQVYQLDTADTYEFPITIIPEKCFFTNTNNQEMGICAADFSDFGSDIPDRWYQGRVSYSDRLWEVYPESGSATQLVNTLSESGRSLDIVDITLNDSGSNIYFTTKQDQTLWLYERIPSEQPNETE